MSDIAGQIMNVSRIEAAERTTARAAAGKWNGRGDPPNREAAIEWAISRGVPKAEAQKIAGGSRRALGTSARRIVTEHSAAAQQRRVQERRQTGQSETAIQLDSDGDGTITEEEATSAAFGDDIFAGLPVPGEASTRGAPLWPFDTSGLSDSEIAAITVEDRDPMAAYGRRYRTDIKGPVRIGARYYAADALAPLRWSAERRADLQRLMHGLGLYGDKKIRLGTWTATDQDVFTAVLEWSNVEGVRWQETLAGWKKVGLPPELAEAIESSQPKKPTIQVTNPIDIRQAAQDVSRELTGTRDDAFAMGAVGGFQAQETAAQSAVFADQEGGGGGTVTQAPSMGAFLEDKLRREQPIEVDGYQFVGQFQNFLSMLGVQ